MTIKKLWAVISSVIVIGAFLVGYFLGKVNPPDDPIVDPDPVVEVTVKEDGVYDSKEEVALYLITYNKLPSNYVTKYEARKAGWEGGSVEPYFPGCCIGGDSFANREGLLPSKKGRSYRECDINTLGTKTRGDERIIYSNDGLIYYTDDHYESFVLLYGEE